MENGGGESYAEGFSVGEARCVLIQLKTSVHSVGLETRGRHVCVVHVGIFVGLGVYRCGMWNESTGVSMFVYECLSDQ